MTRNKDYYLLDIFENKEAKKFIIYIIRLSYYITIIHLDLSNDFLYFVKDILPGILDETMDVLEFIYLFQEISLYIVPFQS